MNAYLWSVVVGLNVFKIFDWSDRKLLTLLLYRLLQNNVCNIVIDCDLFVFVFGVYNFSGCFVLDKAAKESFKIKFNLILNYVVWKPLIFPQPINHIIVLSTQYGYTMYCRWQISTAH